MSLLIDALRQAEANQKQAGVPADTCLQIVSDEPQNLSLSAPQTVAVTSDATPDPATAESSRAVVRDLFEIKRSPANRLPLILSASILGLLALGGIWWASQFQGSATLSSVPAPLPATSIHASAPQIVTPTAPGPVPPPSTLATLDQANLPKKPMPTAQEPAWPTTQHPVLQRTQPLREPEDSATQPGFAAYAAGNLGQARQELFQALQADPQNIEALNAMAMIALRNGHPEEAERNYRQALLIDPKDANARAQLALLYSEADPVTAESRLRLLLIEQPESAPALFALGNIQARQDRWHEAQQAFFKAHALDTNNADMLYNLAVSLDHLNQPALAQQYYTRAATAAARHPEVVAFDLVAAQHRANLLAHTTTAASTSARP